MKKKAEIWLTTVDQEHMLSRQEDVEISERAEGVGGAAPADYTVRVDPGRHYQEMDGFGASFTDASAYLAVKCLGVEARKEMMRKLFDPEEGIGMTMLRQPMGATDYTTEIYSYNDLPEGEEDFELARFSIDHDRDYVIPAVKEALAINPRIKVMASPWSAPGWMKTSGHMVTGTLRPECYGVYAEYFVKFIQAYEAEGIPVYAVTVQNEPGYGPGHYPGMVMKPEEELRFIRDYLGPAFRREGISALIMCYDHNWDVPAHPLAILEDPEASQYVAGVAWHVYGGKPEAMSLVHDAFPEKGAWFTEASGGEWIPAFRTAYLDQMRNVIAVPRNWGKSIVWWNVALDEVNGPTVLPHSTCRGVVKIVQATGEIIYNLDYYTMGHISKFVRPGAWHIESDHVFDELETVAFLNPDGSKALIATNRTAEAKTVEVSADGGTFRYTLPGEGSMTAFWR